MQAVRDIDKLTEKIIGMAIEVHKKLGPGFQERIYERALINEFNKSKIRFSNQTSIKIVYEGIDIGKQKLDFIIEDQVILELKSTSKIIDLFQAQLLSYLKASDLRVGLILNFGRKILEIKRLVNKL
jgi:GxxExxY protein